MKGFRSNCPLGRALDVLGDKWTLLVLRDIVAFQKTTFKEISLMKEGIATNILTERLNRLKAAGLITKTKSKTNKLVYHYHPTLKAIDLVPAMLLLRDWSEKFLFQNDEVPSAIGVI